MSVNLMSAIFETEFFDLQDEKGNVTKASTAKLVLLAMADHANDEGEGAYPSVARLCRKTALSEQTIRNTFDALKHNGIIALDGKSKYGTNNHTINTKSFPKAIGKEVTVLTLYPLGGLMGGGGGSNGSLSTPLTVIPESSINDKDTSSETPQKPDLVDLELQKKARRDEFEPALLAFERDMRTPGNWTWYPSKTTQEPEWRALRNFIVKLYAEDEKCFEKYNTWRTQPYVKGAMSNRQIKNYPADFEASWSDYLAHSTMYPPKSKAGEPIVRRDPQPIRESESGIPISY